MGNAYGILIGNPERKRTLGRSTRRWEVDIKIVLKGTGCDCANSI
jgi:hypothetical protein